MSTSSTSSPAATKASSGEQMNIVIVGHVDHGKSTIIGRLLADTDSLPEGKLQQIRDLCERTSKPFEYAFLLDALKDEQAQGITIDAARVFFQSARRHYLIIDAPGHIEFLKNMITGASRAEAALLVIDAAEGVRENSRRHGYLLSMLGLRQVAVLVNKMDLVGYRQEVFERIRAEYAAFLRDIGLEARIFLPVSVSVEYHIATTDGSAGRKGDLRTLLPDLLSWADAVVAAADMPFYRHLGQAIEAARVLLPKGYAQALYQMDFLCGTGACQACAVDIAGGRRRVCPSGPVFDLVDILR